MIRKPVIKLNKKGLGIVPLLFVVLMLTACGVSLSGLNFSSSDTLESMVKDISDARTQYVQQAVKSLSDRGVAIALGEDNVGSTIASINFDDLAGEGMSGITTISELDKCILFTSCNNTDNLIEGEFVGRLKDEDEGGTVAYKFFYGDAKYTVGEGDSATSYHINNSWILWMDLPAITDTTEVTWDNIKELPDVDRDFEQGKVGSGDETDIACAYAARLKDSIDIDGNGTPFYIIWDTEGIEWEPDPEDLDHPDEDPDVIEGDFSFTKNFGTASAGNLRDALKLLYAITGPSTVLCNSNNYLNAGLWHWDNNIYAYKRDGYLTSGTLADYDIYSWGGTSDYPNTPEMGSEVLCASVIDYGRIYVLDPNTSASEIHDLQKKLYNCFGNGETSVVVGSSSVSENAVMDGVAVISGFRPENMCVIPPGFGILSYSMIPRTGLLSNYQSNGKAIPGVVVQAGGTGESTSVGLSFIGPNPKVIDIMNGKVLGESGGGFAIINQHIYLMSYPVSTINYLYTDEDGKEAYIGIGPAPIYYNLIYDRLDYKYGEDYAYQKTTESDTEDDLYKDYNFVGGIACTDTTNVGYSEGGVMLLTDADGHVTTCRVQLADEKNIEDAKTAFAELVDEYYVRPVPVWDDVADVDGDSSTTGNQSPYLLADDGTMVSVQDLFTADTDNTVLQIVGGTPYFQKDISGYLDMWANTNEKSSLEVPQFVLLDYVESTLLPGAGTGNNVAVTGRKLRILASAIRYDADRNLYYFVGQTGTQIGKYVSIDGMVELDKIFLGDIVDVRALSGIGYSKLADDDIDSVQPPYGFNNLFPIGVSIDDYATALYQTELTSATSPLRSEITDWVADYADDSGNLDISGFASMSNWVGHQGTFANSSTYQTISAANNVAILSATDHTGDGWDGGSAMLPTEAGILLASVYHSGGGGVVPYGCSSPCVRTPIVYFDTADTDALDEDGNLNQEFTSVVAALAVEGAVREPHLGVEEVNMNTMIDELPYVPTNIITFSEPFPNTMYSRDDAGALYQATDANASVPHTMYTVCVGTGISHGNLYHGWVMSEAPTDSLLWWNNYLSEHNFDYHVSPQIVQQYIETNYSYLANADNKLRFDMESAQYWSETLDVLNPNRGGIKTLNMILTASNILGWALVIYSLICILMWAVDIYGGLDKDFYKLMTGGRYVASAEKLPAAGGKHYATFTNALMRSVLISICGIALIYVGAGVLLAKLFKGLALVLRLIFGYWS